MTDISKIPFQVCINMALMFINVFSLKYRNDLPGKQVTYLVVRMTVKKQVSCPTRLCIITQLHVAVLYSDHHLALAYTF